MHRCCTSLTAKQTATELLEEGTGGSRTMDAVKVVGLIELIELCFRVKFVENGLSQNDEILQAYREKSSPQTIDACPLQTIRA